MKYLSFRTRTRQLFLALTCLTASLLLSQCRVIKGKQQTPVAAAEKSVDSNPKKPLPTIIPTIDKSAPPVGFWTEEESGLYVSIRPRSEHALDEEYRIAVGDLIIAVGGPPNKRNNADDVFFLSQHTLGKNKLNMRGFFNWDRNKNEVEIAVTWTESSVTLQIFKNEKFTHYDAKLYHLNLRK